LSEANDKFDADEYAAILALGMIPGMGNTRVNRLLKFIQQRGWDMTVLRAIREKACLRQFVMWDATIAGLLGQCSDEVFEEGEKQVEYTWRQGLGMAHIMEESYPRTLKHFLGESAPPILFTRGNPTLLHKTAGAVVGTRSPSKRGVKAAQQAALAITRKAKVLVSGGAAGVDYAGHDAVIRAGGNTVVMLPQGIVSWSCPKHWEKALEDGRIALVSAYLPDAPWQTHGAVSRNALISAMAQVVCVVEPRKLGGSILTMRHAIEQGKPVFVEPVNALPTHLRPLAQPLKGLQATLNTLDFEKALLPTGVDSGQIELL